jgi:hypothetical protein
MHQRLNPYQTCKLFMNVRNHFTKDKFDVFSSNGIRYSEANYEKRPDKAFYQQLAYDYASGDLGYYFMSNLLAGAKHPSEMNESNYKEWKSKMFRIEKMFEEDCMLIQSYMIQQELTFNDFFVSTTGGLPIAIQMLNGNLINIETICSIDAIFDGFIIRRMDEQINDEFIWKSVRLKIVKYAPWISRYFEADKLKAILKNYT